METAHPGTIDYVILAIYSLFVLGIGWALKPFVRTSNDFFRDLRRMLSSLVRVARILPGIRLLTSGSVC